MNAAEPRAKGPGGDRQERASASGESRPLLLYPFEVGFCVEGLLRSFAAVSDVVCGAASYVSVAAQPGNVSELVFCPLQGF